MAGQHPPARPGGSALSRVPKIYLYGGGAAAVAGLALFMRKRSAKKNGQNATTPATTQTAQDLSEATYDTSVYDSYNDLQSEYQGLQSEVNGLVQPVSPGNTNPNPSPVPTPTPPPLQGGNPPSGPHPPVPAPPSPTPKPTPTPPKPTPTPTKRTQVVAKWTSKNTPWNSTLWGIAQHYYGSGTQWPKIYAANRALIGGNPNNIKAGQVLTIP